MEAQTAMGDDIGRKELISVFNEGKFQILRLHIIKINCNDLSKRGKLIEWKWELDTWWRELIEDFYEQILSEDEQKVRINMGLLNRKIAIAKERGQLYEALHEKECYLRYLTGKIGKGSKKTHGDDDDMDN